MRGAVSSGHPLTSAAAVEVLQKGGNAFDAAVAAGFASAVTEPFLTSLGGGGFLLAHIKRDRRDILYDFFVDAPGKGSKIKGRPEMRAVEVRFPSHIQRFYIGWGSVAVPGTLMGLITVQRELARLPMAELLGPALRYLNEGVPVNENQRYQIELLEPILGYSPYGKEIYLDIRNGRLFNPLLRDFLSTREPEQMLRRFYIEGGQALQTIMEREGGLLTAEDMATYRVIKREPAGLIFNGYTILTNPPPSTGGPIILHALRYISQRRSRGILRRVEAMEEMNRHLKRSTSGTTHISILDGEGNAVSMTLSNGTGSGCFIPYIGVMLNNMMGEEDLHREGFFQVPPGMRVTSMMSPTIVKNSGAVHAVLGTGGSKRIRTALIQVILNLLEDGMDIVEAIESPRLHLDEDGTLHLEPGLDDIIPEVLTQRYRIRPWPSKDMFFGGVNAVMGEYTGHADSRRGGSFLSINNFKEDRE